MHSLVAGALQGPRRTLRALGGRGKVNRILHGRASHFALQVHYGPARQHSQPAARTAPRPPRRAQAAPQAARAPATSRA